MVWVSLEVAIGFVVKLAVCHQFLHAGEGLRAAQGGTAEEFAWQGRVGGQRSGVGWPRSSWRLCLPPTLICHPHPTLALPSRDCVGGQWVRRCCARSRMLGKLRQQPGLEQGICFPVGCTQPGHLSLPHPRCPGLSTRKAYTWLELPYGFLPGPLFCLLH